MRRNACTAMPCIIPVPRSLTGAESTVMVIILVLASALAASGQSAVNTLQLLTGAGLAGTLVLRTAATTISAS